MYEANSVFLRKSFTLCKPSKLASYQGISWHFSNHARSFGVWLSIGIRILQDAIVAIMLISASVTLILTKYTYDIAWAIITLYINYLHCHLLKTQIYSNSFPKIHKPHKFSLYFRRINDLFFCEMQPSKMNSIKSNE